MNKKARRGQGGRAHFLDRVPLAVVGSSREEWASSTTHAAASVGAVVALVELDHLAAMSGLTLPFVTMTVFGLSLLNLYLVSTFYHLVENERKKRLLRLLDHLSILYLIAGSYTVVSMLFLHGPTRWVVLSVEWGLAFTGTIYKVLFLGRVKALSIGVYLVMGWLALIAWPQMISLRAGGLNLWLLLGGIAYTVGLIFFGAKRIPYNHAIWHLFVMAGSACHIYGIYQATRIIYG